MSGISLRDFIVSTIVAVTAFAWVTVVIGNPFPRAPLFGNGNEIARWLNENNQSYDNAFWVARIWRGDDVDRFLGKTFNTEASVRAKGARIDPQTVDAIVIWNLDVGLTGVRLFPRAGFTLDYRGGEAPAMIIGDALNKVRDEIVQETGLTPPTMPLRDCVYAAQSCRADKELMGAGGFVFRRKI